MDDLYYDDADDDDVLFSDTYFGDDNELVAVPPPTPAPRVTVPVSPPNKYAHDRSKPRCRYCLSSAVYWDKEDGKWRLFDSKLDIPHSCVSYRKVSAANDLIEGQSQPVAHRDAYWTIDFYEPDEDVKQTKPFAQRIARNLDRCDEWLKYAEGIGAKIVVRHVIESTFVYGDES